MRRGACGACLHAAITLVLKNLPEPAVDSPAPRRREVRRGLSEAAWRWPLRVAALFASGLLMMTTLFSVCLSQRSRPRATDEPSHPHRAALGDAAGPIVRGQRPPSQPRVLADPTLYDGACVCSEPRGW